MPAKTCSTCAHWHWTLDGYIRLHVCSLITHDDREKTTPYAITEDPYLAVQVVTPPTWTCPLHQTREGTS